MNINSDSITAACSKCGVLGSFSLLPHNTPLKLIEILFRLSPIRIPTPADIQGGSNMIGTDLYVNKPHCAAVWGRVSPTETLFPILLLESVVNFSGRDVFSNEDLIAVRCSTLRGTFCSLITLATPRQD